MKQLMGVVIAAAMMSGCINIGNLGGGTISGIDATGATGIDATGAAAGAAVDVNTSATSAGSINQVAAPTPKPTTPNDAIHAQPVLPATTIRYTLTVKEHDTGQPVAAKVTYSSPDSELKAGDPSVEAPLGLVSLDLPVGTSYLEVLVEAQAPFFRSLRALVPVEEGQTESTLWLKKRY